MINPARRIVFAFTLVELLVVIGIISLLMVLVVPSLNGISHGSSMGTAGNTMVSQILLAQQLAIGKRRPTEIRFYQIPSKSSSGYSAMQIYQISGTSGIQTSVTLLESLPDGVVICSDTNTFSPLLSGSLTAQVLPKWGTCNYQAFDFRSNGMPLVSSSNMVLTAIFKSDQAKVDAGTTPTNYACVKIQPVTGHPALYRP